MIKFYYLLVFDIFYQIYRCRPIQTYEGSRLFKFFVLWLGFIIFII